MKKTVFAALVALMTALTPIQSNAAQASVADSILADHDTSVVFGVQGFLESELSGVSLYANNLGYGETVAFAQFDLGESPLLGGSLESASLDVFGNGFGVVDLYYVANDSWVTNPNAGVPFTSLISKENLMGSLDLDSILPTGSEMPYSIGFSNLNFLSAELNNPSDGMFSVAMLSRDMGNTLAARALENPGIGFAPTLNTSGTPAPAPEPSTLLLGLMGASGFFASRKRK